MKVLIVDDDTFVAQSLATILSVEPDVEVVGLGASGPEAVEGYRRYFISRKKNFISLLTPFP